MSLDFGNLAFRRVVISFVSVASAIYAGLQIPDNPLFPFMLFGACVYLATLGVNYQLLAWIIIATSSSALIVPGLPGRPFFWEAAAMAAWPSLAVHLAMRKESIRKIWSDADGRKALFCLVTYVAVLVVIMMARGVGFRVFGGEQMGGRFYVQQLSLAILPVLFIVVDWTPRALLTCFFAGAVLSATYLVSDFAFIGGGVASRILLTFLELPTDAINFFRGYELTGLRRFQSLAAVGDAAFYSSLVLFSLRDVLGRWALLAWPVVGGSLAIGMASGHRNLLVQSALTLLVLSVIQRILSPVRVVLLTITLALATVGLYHFSHQLPLSMQRAVSFLPGIQIDSVAAIDAEATLRDRIEVMKLAVADVPRYLLLGRGFGMQRLDQLPRGTQNDLVYLAYENGYFENGTIGVLLKNGLPGLLAALGFAYYVSRAAKRALALVAERPPERQDLFDRLTQLIAARWYAGLLFFFLIRGDSSTFMQVFALPAAMVLACLQCQLKRSDDALPAALPSMS